MPDPLGWAPTSQPLAGLPDADLVPRAVGGDALAIGELLSRHRPRLWALCRRLVGPQLAEDCAQDACLVALVRLSRLRDPAAFGAWLRGIAVRVCRRAVERNQLRPLPPEAEAHDPGADLGAALAARVDLPELSREVRLAVADLPEGQRAAVRLFYLEGHAYDAAAARLGIPVGALKTRLHKARAALRHRYRLADASPRPASAGPFDRRTLAVHEGAHGVLYWLHGGQVLRIAVAPVSGTFLQGPRPTSGHQVAPVHALHTLMAGEAATFLDRASRTVRASGDRDAAGRLALDLTGGDPVEAALAVGAALTAARDRLADHRTWLLVERIAAALAARDALDADEFRVLVSGGRSTGGRRATRPAARAATEDAGPAAVEVGAPGPARRRAARRGP